MSADLWIRVDDPVDGAHVVCLVDEAVIGRDLHCDVVIHDDEASRHHARLSRLADRRWQIMDLGTTNGTFVNSERIVGAAEISVGDIIRVGRVSCAIVAPTAR